MNVALVAARARNGVIGDGGTIPWHLPGDFQHFKQVTLGHPLIMGRVTFESIGRPLPGRQSIVVTRDLSWAYDGVIVAHDIDEALQKAAELDDVINVAGGAQIYVAAMPFADTQILTEIDLTPPGDVRYPDFDEADWVEVDRVAHDDEPVAWTVRTLQRRAP